jgi:hypothetical protein
MKIHTIFERQKVNFTLQSRSTFLKSKFFPAKFSFYKIQKKNLAGKNTLQKSEVLFEPGSQTVFQSLDKNHFGNMFFVLFSCLLTPNPKELLKNIFGERNVTLCDETSKARLYFF